MLWLPQLHYLFSFISLLIITPRYLASTITKKHITLVNYSHFSSGKVFIKLALLALLIIYAPWEIRISNIFLSRVFRDISTIGDDDEVYFLFNSLNDESADFKLPMMRFPRLTLPREIAFWRYLLLPLLALRIFSQLWQERQAWSICA